jgi:N-acetylmuramoyl-L-alanine amidase
MLDEIRRRLGAPVRILSCYRSPAYNSCIGGESASLHMKFNAIDWRCDSGSVQEWHRAAKDVRRSKPEFLGGVGLYVNSRFIHIDTRGHEANWQG